jgi:hypothetical protein
MSSRLQAVPRLLSSTRADELSNGSARLPTMRSASTLQVWAEIPEHVSAKTLNTLQKFFDIKIVIRACSESLMR